MQDVADFLDGHLSYDSFYRRWYGVRLGLGSWPLETDPDVLELLGMQGRLRIDEFYRDTN